MAQSAVPGDSGPALNSVGLGMGHDGRQLEPWRAGPVARQLWQHGPGTAFLLSQARHAQTVLLALLKARGVVRPVVALPAFYAESTLAQFRAAQADLRFYAMTPELGPDWQRIDAEVAQHGPPHIFVLVHYYGMVGEGEAARRFADQHGALLFEDAAHTMLPAGGIGGFGQIACYSPRKYYDSGDGAVVVANGEALADELQAVVPRIPSATPGASLHRLRAWRDRVLPWRHLNGPLPYRGFDQDWDGRANAAAAVWMSRSTSRRIERLGRAGAEAILRRELANARAIVNHVEAATPLRALPSLPDIAPYLLGLRGRTRSETEAAYELLWAAGANVGSWPDLPRVVREWPERYGAALELRHTILRVVPRFTDRRDPLAFIGRLPRRSLPA